MTGVHRGARIPWAVRLGCWLFGHQPEQLGPQSWRCTRCDRCAHTPVELP